MILDLLLSIFGPEIQATTLSTSDLVDMIFGWLHQGLGCTVEAPTGLSIYQRLSNSLPVAAAPMMRAEHATGTLDAMRQNSGIGGRKQWDTLTV